MRSDDATMARLMALAQNGDKVAYATLLTSAERWLKGYFTRRTAPNALDDLIQETLISLHRKRASYDPSRPFLPWLAAIARYRWVDHLRKFYRANESELDDTLASGSHENDVTARISIDALLTLLPPKQAEAIRLVKIDGLSIAEASERCGQSEPLVKVNIHRGLKKLAAVIEKE